MKGTYKILLLLVIVATIIACSRKNNTFINRNAHAVKAEFNGLYNGNVAFEQGKKEITQGYTDNFWEILPVERIQLEEDMVLPGKSKNANFEKAEEKAAKVIQKHSMYINEKEYNPQIDEAFILLGKARYYDQRFVPALDAFNYILDKYPTCNNINQAKVWKAKSNIRLKNPEGAIEDLKKLLKERELEGQDLADATAILSQAFIELDSLDAALPFIKKAAQTEKNKELVGRYTFIKGQLYDRLGYKDSANIAYDEVIALKRKSPRVYMINAYIAKAKNFDYAKEDKVALLKTLQKLEKNRENRPFLDKIYNQLGEYYRNNNSIDTAVVYYNKSIKAFKDDKILQAVNYQTLAEINFDQAQYRVAGAYYDSTLTQLAEGTRTYRRIKKKRDNLDDVIKYEEIAIKNDSIIRLASMSKTEQIAFFKNYTDRLKQQAKEDSIANVKAEEAFENNEFYKKNTASGPNSNQKAGGKFYFYNPTMVAYGKQEFKKIWGNRKLSDNWRLSSKNTLSTPEEDQDQTEAEVISEDDLFKPETYLALIPKDKKVIDSLAKERDFAYYQLGLIYKEKFKEYQLAADRLEKLLTLNPEKRLILPSKYHLYKIYQELGNTEKAQYYKNDIITNNPDSRYAEILKNPEADLATDESSPEYKYKALFKAFENQNYQKVIKLSETYITQYFGDPIVPKFELLKATALARQDGFDAYKKALNYIALNYPNAKEGKQAQEIISTVLPKLANKSFYGDTQSKKWKICYPFEANDTLSAKALQEKLNDAIAAFGNKKMKTSIDYYNPQKKFVVLHGLDTRLGAKGFAEILNTHKDFKITNEHFEISSPNYEIVQIHKNLEEYLAADLSKAIRATQQNETKQGGKRGLSEEEEKLRQEKIKRDIKMKEAKMKERGGQNAPKKENRNTNNRNTIPRGKKGKDQ